MVMNELDRLHLVSSVIDRVPKLGEMAAYAQQIIREKLIDHKRHVAKYGVDLPEVSNWVWQGSTDKDNSR
jgi:xylulose-5-phosphate/fructose-6-phosphate phosphoketolase